MRRPLLVLGGTVAALALAGIGVVVLAPVFLKDRVVALVLDEVNARVDADVALGSADVTLLHAFPDVTLDAADLVVTGRGPFAGVELARVGKLGVTLDLMSVLGGGPVRVTGLALADTTLDVRVDAEGRANTALTGVDAAADPAAPAAPAAASDAPPTELWLRDVAIENFTLRYDDVPAGRRVTVSDLDLTGDAEVGGDLVALRTKATVGALSVTNAGIALLKEAKLASDLDVRYAPATGAVRLGEGTTVRVNDLGLAVSGAVEPGAAGTALDLAFAADKTTFKGLLSLVPGAYTPDFGGVQADGTLVAKGAVKGLLADAGDDLPAFDLALQVTDGRFRYPDLPAAVTDIQLDIAVKHPGGPPDAVVVDIPRFRLAVDGSPLEGRLALRTPVSDPAVDTRVKGRLDLGRLSAAFPDAVSGWTGTMDVDLDLAGKVSAFSAGDVDAVRAAGTFTLADATWTDPSQPLPITVEELALAVDPRKVDLTSFRLRFGDSDLRAKGGVENAIGWALADQTLVGRLEATSSKLDLNPWAGGDDATGGPDGAPRGASKSAGDDDSSLFAVPKGLDLALAVDFGRVLYDGWDLRDVRGGARVKDGAIRLDDLRARTLGGEVGISGTYAAPTDAAADVDLRVSATDLGAADTLAQLEIARKVLPGLQNVKGTLRTGFGVQARLGKDLRPDLASFASVGKLGGTGLAVGAAFLAPVAELLGDDRYTSLALDGGDVGFEVKKGRLKLDRMPVALGPAKGHLGGNTGVLDESLDLKLDLAVPASIVPTKALTGALAGVAGKKLDTLDVKATIGGTWTKPSVKLGLGDSLGGVVDTVKDAALEKVGEAVDALLAKAEAQGDALIAEAERQAQKLRDEAAKQGDRLRAEADTQAKKLVKDAKGNPLKEAAAKEAGKALRAEADKAAKKVEKEADKQADAAVAAARREKEKLVTAAKAKVPK